MRCTFHAPTKRARSVDQRTKPVSVSAATRNSESEVGQRQQANTSVISKPKLAKKKERKKALYCAIQLSLELSSPTTAGTHTHTHTTAERAQQAKSGELEVEKERERVDLGAKAGRLELKVSALRTPA